MKREKFLSKAKQTQIFAEFVSKFDNFFYAGKSYGYAEIFSRNGERL